jgi:uncharacterized protein
VPRGSVARGSVARGSVARGSVATGPSVLELETPHGPARAHVHRPPGSPRGLLVLGHGAAGGVGAADLQAASAVAVEGGLAVALTEQPYRVAGRRSPAPARQLDTAFTAIVGQVVADAPVGVPLITGGRSSGARVACRTAATVGAQAVLCLAFPLLAPARRGQTERASRLDELEAVEVPVLVVQGRSDPFGMPPTGRRRTVVQVDGDHSLRKGLPELKAAVTEWLAEQLGAA